MKIISLLFAIALALASCQTPVGQWAQSPGGREVINAGLTDALKIVSVLLLAAGPQTHISLRIRATNEMLLAHPEYTYEEAQSYVDEAIRIKTHVVVIQE